MINLHSGIQFLHESLSMIEIFNNNNKKLSHVLNKLEFGSMDPF